MPVWKATRLLLRTQKATTLCTRGIQREGRNTAIRLKCDRSDIFSHKLTFKEGDASLQNRPSRSGQVTFWTRRERVMPQLQLANSKRTQVKVKFLLANTAMAVSASLKTGSNYDKTSSICSESRQTNQS